MSYNQLKQNKGSIKDCPYIFRNVTDFEIYCKEQDFGVRPDKMGTLFISDPLAWMAIGIAKGVFLSIFIHYTRNELIPLLVTSAVTFNDMITKALSTSGCDYNHYSSIDISEPTKFNCLDQLKKYTIEHNDSYITIDQCHENDTMISSISPWHTEEICKDADLEVIDLYLCQITDSNTS